MKRILAFLLSLLMMSMLPLASMADILNVAELASATDEELEEALQLIQAEKKARLKTTIALDVETIEIKKGGSQRVTPTVIDLEEGVKAGKTFTWATSDAAVATVSNGTIKGVGFGTAVITVTNVLSDETEITAEIPVSVYVAVESIAFAEKKLEVMAGDELKAEMVFKPADATNQSVIYTSSDESILRVDEENRIYGVAMGSAKLNAEAADGSGRKAAITVTVTKRVGRFEGPVTYQGLQWGSSPEELTQPLRDLEFLEENRELYVYPSGWTYYWPAKNEDFANYETYRSGSLFGDTNKGTLSGSISMEKTIGGHAVGSVYFSFLNDLKDGEIDTEIEKLVAVFISFSTKYEDSLDIFTDLLTKLEAQYGEFEFYQSATNLRYSLGSDRAKEAQKVLASYLKGATTFGGKNDWPSIPIFAILRGQDNTGIMLAMNGYDVLLMYGRTDVAETIEAMKPILEAELNSKDDVGL